MSIIVSKQETIKDVLAQKPFLVDPEKRIQQLRSELNELDRQIGEHKFDEKRLDSQRLKDSRKELQVLNRKYAEKSAELLKISKCLEVQKMWQFFMKLIQKERIFASVGAMASSADLYGQKQFLSSDLKVRLAFFCGHVNPSVDLNNLLTVEAVRTLTDLSLSNVVVGLGTQICPNRCRQNSTLFLVLGRV